MQASVTMPRNGSKRNTTTHFPAIYDTGEDAEGRVVGFTSSTLKETGMRSVYPIGNGPFPKSLIDEIDSCRCPFSGAPFGGGERREKIADPVLQHIYIAKMHANPEQFLPAHIWPRPDPQRPVYTQELSCVLCRSSLD